VTRPEPASSMRCTYSVVRTQVVRWVVSLAALACVVSLVSAGASTAAQRGGRVQFWSGRSGSPAVWDMRIDGSGKRLLTRFPENAKRGVLSPDGRRLAFDGAAPGQQPMSNFDVQVMNIDGTKRVRLTSEPEKDIDAQWSPDGKLLSYTRQADDTGRKTTIWTMRPDGTHKRRLAAGQLARWSPDGRRIVFGRWIGDHASLFILDLGSHRMTRLTTSPLYDEPAGWSPDGRTILFTRDNPGSGSDIYSIAADGSSLRRLSRAASDDYACAFSPNGSEILFTSNRTGHDQVFIMRADGANARNISRSVTDDEATQWHS
jgi:Tol biopolymer transport system component